MPTVDPNIPTAMQRLPMAQFGDSKIRVSNWEVKGSQRKHVHVYWKVPGGQTEKGQRGLYTMPMKLHFDEGDPDIPDAFPDLLTRMRAMYESGETQRLLVPNIGFIDAWITEWHEHGDGMLQSGMSADVTFEEDSDEAGVDAIVLGGTITYGLATANQALDVAAEFVKPWPDKNTSDIFDSIKDIANAIQALQDQAGLFDNQLATKINVLIALCDRASHTSVLQDMSNWTLLNALLDVWAAAKALAADISQRGSPVLHFPVPRTMAIGEVATAIYGDSSRAVELLQLNPIDDAYAIPRGFEIKYYEAA